MSLKDELQKLYWEDGLTQEAIGKIYGKSKSWIHNQMKKYNILTKDTVDIKTRFLRYVKIPENPGNCWIWLGYKDSKGYGQFIFNGKNMLAHRVSYILHVREFDPTLCCLHSCDNPGCVNPDHLFLGTLRDNTKDMIQKGRHGDSKGEKNGRSKLTEKDVIEIKTLLLQGTLVKEVAKIYQVIPNTISRIKQGHLWNHIK